MQLLAQRMYKITSKSKYIFWSVASMLLSFQRSNTPDSTLLMLGERMLLKIIGNTIDQPGGEELLMLIEILEKQQKFSEALERLEEMTARPAGLAIGICPNYFMIQFYSTKTHLVSYSPLRASFQISRSRT